MRLGGKTPIIGASGVSCPGSTAYSSHAQGQSHQEQITRTLAPPDMRTSRRMKTTATTQEAADQLLLAVRPPQGCWSETDYLWLTDHCSHLVEFADGHIEELPLPTDTHQTVLAFLFRLLDRHVEARGGVVRFAALRLRIREGRFREPDLLLLRDANDPRRQDRYWLGADLAVEVVSPDDPDRDYEEKRADYAEAGIHEYWIADPERGTITVLTLENGHYAEHGVFGRGDTATSALLDELAVDVSAALDVRTPYGN